MESVGKTLNSLDLTEIPTILALNKSDRLNGVQTARLAKKLDGIPISALNPSTLSELKKAMADIIF
jgi:50S ribosomal subunit-associated GTPase HflX